VSVARDLLACPACGGGLSPAWRCATCGARFAAGDGIPKLTLDVDARTDTVRRFYDATPFPGYPPRDDLASFRLRAERSRFAELLDRAIDGDARVVDVGCGTGQMPLFLARANRTIVAVDISRQALLAGASAARRFGIQSVQFVETDLHRPGLRAEAFDVVYSAGVLHHTADPRAAFGRVVRLARPGGILIVGVYNAFARIPLRVRRAVARLTNGRIVAFDPVLRDRRDEPLRREAWQRDQYQHPEEHRHTVAEVRRWFAAHGIDYLRTYPTTLLEDDPGELFGPAGDDWNIECWLAQLGWIWTLGREGGLFFTIGRRQ
jgi:ubiquinone/menaquinone biosynthesis C-methylase UbiE